MVMTTKLTISIPLWLDRLCAWPVLLYRKHKYGYTFRRIYLGEGRFTLVDHEVFYRLNIFQWYADGKGEKIYAVRNIVSANENPKIVRLHREIMNPPKGLLVDHKNRNTLDNRRDNLRIATVSQNACNCRRNKSNASSQFKGVCLEKRIAKWIAVISRHGKRIHLGTFDNEIDAAKAYDEAAKKYHGEFARLNFSGEFSNVERRTTNNL
jgi:hypothetical protein